MILWRFNFLALAYQSNASTMAATALPWVLVLLTDLHETPFKPVFHVGQGFPS